MNLAPVFESFRDNRIKGTLEEHGFNSTMANKTVDMPLERGTNLKWSFDFRSKRGKRTYLC